MTVTNDLTSLYELDSDRWLEITIDLLKQNQLALLSMVVKMFAYDTFKVQTLLP
jgi:hypothetical protein